MPSRSLRCTIFDRFFINAHDMGPSAAFFYDRKLDDRALAASLESVLGEFSPFTARVPVKNDELLLECGEAGALFIVERQAHPMAEAMSNLFNGEAQQLTERLNTRRALAKGAPALTVKVTHFSDDKTSIGMCWNHWLRPASQTRSPA